MIELYPAGIGHTVLGKTLRITQPSAYGADVVLVGPLVAIEQRLMHPRTPGRTVRTHLQIGTHTIDTDQAHTIIQLVDDLQDEVEEEEG